jgi:hypothetical protein
MMYELPIPMKAYGKTCVIYDGWILIWLPIEAQYQGKAFEDSFVQFNDDNVGLPGLRDDLTLRSPFSLSSSPNISESFYGGTSKRNSSEEPNSPTSSHYQLPIKSQPSPQYYPTNATTIPTFDSSLIPQFNTPHVSVQIPQSQLVSPTTQPMQPLMPMTFTPNMPNMLTMPTMPQMTYDEPNSFLSPSDSPATDFLDAWFASYSGPDQSAPVAQSTQNSEEFLFDMDEASSWTPNFISPMVQQQQPQAAQEDIYSPTIERINTQLETYFLHPDQHELRRTLEQIQGAPWLIAHHKEPNDSTTKRSIYLTFISSKGDKAGGNSYRCLFDGCGKCFDRHDRAIGHIRMHFGHRPFRCNAQCGVADW